MKMNAEILKENAIAMMQSEIKKKRQQIEFIRTVDMTKPTTEKVWHELCETPIRNSELLKVLVLNTWPDAEDIILSPNCVRFVLYGYGIIIPTTRSMGVEIVPDPSFKYFREYKPIFRPSHETKRRLKYIDMRNSDTDWYTLFQLKVPEDVLDAGYHKWYCLLLWLTKYKKMEIDEEEWNRKYDDEKKAYKKKMEKYYDHQEELYKKCIILIENVIPEIQKFSTNIRLYKDTYCTMDDVMRMKNGNGLIMEK